MAEDVPENHVVSEDVGMLTGVTECISTPLSVLNFSLPPGVTILGAWERGRL